MRVLLALVLLLAAPPGPTTSTATAAWNGRPPERLAEFAATDTATRSPAVLAATDTATRSPAELAATDTATRSPTELAATDTAMRRAAELAATDTATRSPAVLADADPWALGAALAARSPARLGTGLLLGPEVAVGAPRPVVGPLVLGARLGLALGAEDDLTWHVHHTELRLLARVGAELRHGRWHVGVSLSAGVVVLHEQRTRHQADRLVEAGQATEATAWSVGPAGALEVELELDVIERWGLQLAGGPSLVGLPSATADASPWGWGARLGVVYRL